MKYTRTTTALMFLGLLLSFAMPARAQESLSISVTPPLFQLSVQAGDFWQSSVKIINSNPYELTVYANVVNFEPTGEEGHGRFVPLVHEEAGAATLGGWLSVNKEPIIIPREQSVDVPFTLEVPQDASPGGHFAAILVGTQPPKDDNVPVAVQTSQVVTSLFFVRVGGDVVEEGDIREFSVEKAFHDTPEANFILRFENKGNVHLQPLGEIVITNMWGKERGFIPINQKTNFGNVLPESIRRFEFAWKGEASLSDIGRYKAEVTLGYGQDNRNFVTSSTYFYVIPLKATLVTVVSVGLFLWFMSWAIRRYIRRAIFLAGYEPVRVKGVPVRKAPPKVTTAGQKRVRPTRDLAAPIRAGVIDLRSGMKNEVTYQGRLHVLGAFIRSYKLFFLSVGAVFFAALGGGLYLTDVLSNQKSYEITIDAGGEEVIISSEEVLKERLSEGTEPPTAAPAEQTFQVTLINASSIPGTAAETAYLMESMGYRIDAISTETSRIQERTVIVYSPSLTDAAVLLSEQLGNAPISARVGETATSTPTLTVVVGEDRSR